MDTTRRDHLSVYGYPRPTTRTLERLAERGVLFLNAFAQQNRTVPSHASMFTGLYPQDHGSFSNKHPLHESNVTLAETLRAAGFRTAAFVSGYTMMKPTGLAQGFELYDDHFGGGRRGADTEARAEAWLRGRKDAGRFFLFVHFFDAHGPYQLPNDIVAFRSGERGRHLDDIPTYQQLYENGKPLEHLNDYVDRYDTLIRYQDKLVARLLEAIDLETTLVVILADHGESLAERIEVLNHGVTLFDEEIRIPLLVAGSGVAAGRVDTAVETVDLLPTILGTLAVPLPPRHRLPGRNLVPLLHGGSVPEEKDRVVFSSSVAGPNRYLHLGYKLDTDRQVHAARTEQWKLIRYPHATRDYIELYDLEQDPLEMHNVAGRHVDVRRRLVTALDKWNAHIRRPVPAEAPLTNEQFQKLRSLGYVR